MTSSSHKNIKRENEEANKQYVLVTASLTSTKLKVIESKSVSNQARYGKGICYDFLQTLNITLIQDNFANMRKKANYLFYPHELPKFAGLMNT